MRVFGNVLALVLSVAVAGCEAPESPTAAPTNDAAKERTQDMVARISTGVQADFMCRGNGRSVGCTCTQGDNTIDGTCKGLKEFCRRNRGPYKCETDADTGKTHCGCGFTFRETVGGDDRAPEPAPAATDSGT